MSDEQGVSLGEVFRGLGRVEKSVEDGFKKVNDRIDNMRSEFVLREVYETRVSAIEEKVDGSSRSFRYWIATLVPALMSCAALLTSILH